MLDRDVDVLDLARRLRDDDTILAKPGNVKLYRFLDELLDLGFGLARCDTTREIGHVSRVITFSLFNHDRVAHYQSHFLRAACLRILLSVPGARSSLGLTSDCYTAGLRLMLKLAMAATGGNQIPTIVV